MLLTEAATLDRKSGEAEGSAVPRTFPGNVFERAVERQRFICPRDSALSLLTIGAPKGGACANSLLAHENGRPATPALFAPAAIHPQLGCGIA
jgi:hypothetical protein